ncbi:hypothetical protein [Flavobacterium sp. ZB4P13]|uniref:hypothetical protein n=1 Tax=Flavobacterium sp. ZB4P13 TaxID=3401728 RepID=UPI003AAB78BB
MTKVEILDKFKLDVFNIPIEAKKLSFDLNFLEYDVRYYFYGLFQNTVNQYYLGWNILFFFEEVDSKKIYKLYFDENLDEFKKNHIEKLFFIQDAKPKETYQRNLNGNLILRSFATFETCINLIFEKLCNKDEFNTYVAKKIKDENSFINNNDFSNAQKEAIIKKLTPDISLHKKIRFITKKMGCYEERENDLTFIEFISDYRNCLIHNNGIFNKNGHEKEYFGSKFIFAKGKELVIQEESLLINWKICFEMKAIFTRLITNLNHDGLIEYPD